MTGFNSLHPTRSCHSKPVLQSHLDVLKEGAFSDVTFIVGPRKERIPAHQLFLRTRSPVFEVMFSERWNQDSNQEVLLEDVDPKIFNKFLQYIYADNLEANVPEALQLLQIAHRYDVQTLVSECEKLMESQLEVDYAVDVFQAARKYDRIQLMDKVGDFMATWMYKFESHPSFLRVDKPFFIYLLKRNDLRIKEVDLFLLVLRWAKGQTGSTPEQSLEDILPLIRFPTMTSNEFTTAVVPTGLLSQSTIVELLIYFGSDVETRKSMVSTLKFSTKQRQPLDSAVAIYASNFDDCKFKREEYSSLNENLMFDISVSVSKVHRPSPVGPFLAFYALFFSQPPPKPQPQPKITLSSISLYCPTWTENSDCEKDETKTFKIFVEAAKDNWGQYHEVLRLPGIEAREGMITEVKFPTQVPLDSQQRYRISVEEDPRELYGKPKMYKVRDFGPIQRSLSTAVGEICVDFKRVRSCRQRAFGERYTEAQLIYKLGLKDMS